MLPGPDVPGWEVRLLREDLVQPAPRGGTSHLTQYSQLCSKQVDLDMATTKQLFKILK